MTELMCRTISHSAASLLDPGASVWGEHQSTTIPMMPTPIAIVVAKSPYLATLTKGHGRVRSLDVTAIRDDQSIWLKMSWASATKSDQLSDLDQFADAAAVLFPLADGAAAVTMGSAGNPVNSWFRSLHRAEAYDVVAEGFGTTDRRPAQATGLQSRASYTDGRWTVVFRRDLVVQAERTVDFTAPGRVGIAFAVWAGANAERSGAKSYSGEFITLRQ